MPEQQQQEPRDDDNRATGDPELPYPARGMTVRSEETSDGGTRNEDDAWEIVDDLTADGWTEADALHFVGIDPPDGAA